MTPAARSTTSGPTATVSTASPKINGVASNAPPTCPRTSATAAVVRPQNGHGTPVSVRSGQGSPAPVVAVNVGQIAAAPATSRPKPPRRSGTEKVRRTTP
jgi:hypothetical protein